MCGIFGYIGEKDPLKACLEGLKRLEYRGYDSAGIAGLKDGKILFFKSEGKINDLEKKIPSKNLKLELAIGHTRWATHGKPITKNAHPHLDYSSSLAVVHNGIIDNYALIKKILQNEKIKFHSDTDTEVIANLISYHYQDDLIDATSKSLKKLKGTFAIALIHKDHPNQIIVATRENPLAIGYDDNKKEIIIASDPNAFLGKDLNVIFLRTDEIAIIKDKEIKIFDSLLKPKDKKIEKFTSLSKDHSKEGHEHFMYKEIIEQPLTIQKAYFGRISDSRIAFENLSFTKADLRKFKNIIIVGCGTSWHAASFGALMLQEIAQIPTTFEIASEFRFKNLFISPETLVIAISQSGETLDTTAAVRAAKAKKGKVLGICNVQNSLLTREADSCLFLDAGPELSVCSTKAFTSQITVLTLFSLYMAELKNRAVDIEKILIELQKIPQKIKLLFKSIDHIKQIAKKYQKFEHFFFLGRHYMYTTAMEAALKLKEISYLNANAYPAGEMKHGPLALAGSHLATVGFCANEKTYDKTLSNLIEVKARGSLILALAPENSKGIQDIADDIIWLPKTIDELSVFPSTVAGQLLAYFIAKERKTDIDKPRNLAKSVTVE